jgi:hypothetical protein
LRIEANKYFYAAGGRTSITVNANKFSSILASGAERFFAAGQRKKRRSKKREGRAPRASLSTAK